ncbi:ICMT-domain-containing protein [Thelephora ganbajun]|uniref:ICMT-domain-containing protein n=1 Tax=Thelephora ganbajun TaxID=370292 RepID=A0ACB6ZB50_THEGA|nr:ICMT-domain-containing protein [Thelephora ganbajun]
MYLSAEAITKSVCFYVAATGVCLCTVPPQPIPSDELREKYNVSSTVSGDESCLVDRPTATRSPMSPRFDYKAASATFSLSYFPYIFSTWVVFMSTLDTFHTLDLFPQIMPVDHTTTARGFNTQLIVGLALIITFSALRFAAFQTLGRFFTYQLSILPDHKLVTRGLYSYIRHPSYTAVPFVFAGVLLTTTAPGSVLYDYLGVDSTRKLMVVLAFAIARGTYVFVCRAEVEDQVLQKEFGKQWEEWTRVVRYKFIPGVL